MLSFLRKIASFSRVDQLLIASDYFFKLAAKDQIATNRTRSTSYPEGLFSPGDTPETYIKKVMPLFKEDIRAAHFDRYKANFLKEGLSEEEAARKAEEKIDAIADKQLRKSILGHTEFFEKLKELGLNPGDKIIAPGSGIGTEVVIAPEYNWRGLEYQENSVNLYNQRSQQMNLPATSEVWSFLKVDPEEELGENWEGKINYFPETTEGAQAIYGKHACGGITDSAIMRACEARIPKMLFATCCADRYTETSWRVLRPNNPDGSPMSFDDYKKISRLSKGQDQKAKDAINKIDSFRQKYLEDHGYNVERGALTHGPYIKAWL